MSQNPKRKGTAQTLRENRDRSHVGSPATAPADNSEARFHALFDAAPSPYLVLVPPDFRIIAVNDAYLRATMTQRETIVGRTLFEVFPENRTSPSGGVRSLRASLERVVAERRLDEMSVTKYDIPRPEALGGGFEERWWKPRNAPVFGPGPDGELISIIHHVEDVTGQVRTENALSEELRNTKVLQDLSARLVREGNIQTIYEDVLSAAIEITRAKAGTVQMLDAEKEELVVLAARGFSPKTEKHFHRPDASSKTSCGLALRTGSRSYFDFDPASADASSRLHVEDGVLSAQSSPLVSRSGKPIGMVSTHWGELGHRLSERELRFLDLLVRQAADLIEQRRSEATLRNNEEQFRRAIEEAPIPVIMHAEDGQVLQISRTWTELTGYRPEDIPTFDAWLNHAYGEGADAVRTHMRDLFAGIRRTLNVEFVVQTRMGGQRHWSFSASSPGTLVDGRRFIIGMAVDITERERAEEALRESEQRLAHDLEATQILQNIGNQLISKPGVNGHFNELCEAARALMRSDCASIQTYDEAVSRLKLVGHVGFHPDSAAFWEWVDAGVGSSCGRALSLGEREIVPDMDLFEADPPDLEAYRRSAILSVQSTPLVARSGQIVGMMSTHWHRRNVAAKASYRFFDILARLAADFIARIRAEAALRETEQRQAMLAAELQHRVRNIMAIIRSITTRTANSATSVDEYAQLLSGRLLALARTQTLLADSKSTGLKLATLVREELNAQAHEQGEYDIQGPEVTISPKAAEVLSLAIHELATNALKYGAFSEPNGRVSVRWEVAKSNGDRWLHFRWSERRAHPLPGAAPARRGFGTELIERRIPYELRGLGSLRFDTGGAQCEIDFPLRHGASVLETDLPQDFAGSIVMKEVEDGADLAGADILILEDDFYLAADLERTLSDCGATIHGPFSTDAAALDWVKAHQPTAALLDINLGRGPSFEVAQLLRAKNIPFIFITGYESAVFPDDFSGYVRLQKPIDLKSVTRALAQLIKSHQPA